MDKEMFTSQLKGRLEELTGCKVNSQTTSKNNGVKLESLVIMREGVNAAPTIYADIWWELYNAGEPFEDIVTKVLEWERKISIDRRIDFDFFLDFNKVKENLRFKVINTEKNKDLLNTIPHKDFMDLSKVYYVEVYTPEMGTGTILVSNAHMENWGADLEEIDRYATGQTEKHNPFHIFDMKDITKSVVMEMADMVKEEKNFQTDMELPNIEMPPRQMYVFTNEQRYLGASVILYKDILKNFAKQIGDNLAILPSSTHELIVVPAGVAGYTGINHLKEMVKEVNATQVEPEEYLSDNVYFYNRQTGRLKII